MYSDVNVLGVHKTVPSFSFTSPKFIKVDNPSCKSGFFLLEAMISLLYLEEEKIIKKKIILNWSLYKILITIALADVCGLCKLNIVSNFLITFGMIDLKTRGLKLLAKEDSTLRIWRWLDLRRGYQRRNFFSTCRKKYIPHSTENEIRFAVHPQSFPKYLLS